MAFNSISGDSRYCKMVHAGDWLFPERIARMVEVADAHPSVGLVGSYTLQRTEVEGNFQDWNFGFVHQVLTFVRIHDESMSASRADRHNTYLPAQLAILTRYGPGCLHHLDELTDQWCLQARIAV